MATRSVYRHFLEAAALKEPAEVPVVIWGVALWYTLKLGITARDYYQGLDLKLKTQIRLQDEFPDFLLLPGMWPDFGVVAEPSAFGCEVVWEEDQAPFARPAISDIGQAYALKPVDVKTAGLLPRVVETYAYWDKHLPRRFREEYGHHDGVVFFLGPLETAATIRGYSLFCMDLIKNPKAVHHLVGMVTDTLIEWLQYLETKIGRLKLLQLCDHFPNQVSRAHFDEFAFPYFKRIFDQFPYAIKLYHNEGRIERDLPRIPEMGTTVFHFGTEIEKTKQMIGDRVCLMGNLDPVGLMQDGSAEAVRRESLKVLDAGARGGGLVLTAAGGFGVNAPDANVLAMGEAVKLFSARRTPVCAQNQPNNPRG